MSTGDSFDIPGRPGRETLELLLKSSEARRVYAANNAVGISLLTNAAGPLRGLILAKKQEDTDYQESADALTELVTLANQTSPNGYYNHFLAEFPLILLAKQVYDRLTNTYRGEKSGIPPDIIYETLGSVKSHELEQFRKIAGGFHGLDFNIKVIEHLNEGREPEAYAAALTEFGQEGLVVSLSRRPFSFGTTADISEIGPENLEIHGLDVMVSLEDRMVGVILLFLNTFANEASKETPFMTPQSASVISSYFLLIDYLRKRPESVTDYCRDY